jgi:hypothetical protein
VSIALPYSDMKSAACRLRARGEAGNGAVVLSEEILDRSARQ